MICELCGTKLVTFRYVGYYDSFYGYKCACETLPRRADSRFIKGAYGFENEWREDTDVEQEFM